MRVAFSALALALAAGPAAAQTPLEQGLAGAFRGCEEWVLNPKSWIDGPAPFLATVGLGDRMGPVKQVAEVSLPPKPLRVGARYWRINSTPGAGYVLVVSDRLPMCHITGGGDTDLQPVTEAVLASEAFAARWERTGGQTRDGMVSTTFRRRDNPAFTLVVSRAAAPGQRLDRVQVVATATLGLAK